jgi:hypothetical protein
VLLVLISAGAVEGHFKRKMPRKVTKGVLFLHNNVSANWALATQKKPYSPDLTPSDYHLLPGLKKELKGCHFSSDTEVIAASETWLDGQPSEFF